MPNGHDPLAYQEIIACLTRERDEARAQAERSQTLLARGKAEAIAKVDSLIRERDKALERAYDAEADRAQRMLECDLEVGRLRALLREARNYLGADLDLNARIDAALRD